MSGTLTFCLKNSGVREAFRKNGTIHELQSWFRFASSQCFWIVIFRNRNTKWDFGESFNKIVFHSVLKMRKSMDKPWFERGVFRGSLQMQILQSFSVASTLPSKYGKQLNSDFANIIPKVFHKAQLHCLQGRRGLVPESSGKKKWRSFNSI